MAGNREVGIPKTTACSLREQVARTTLSRVRAQGHPYLELREDGKRFIFFCTLCLAPCYSDTILLDHLRGNLHTERLSAAKATLLKPNPWPFSDGIHFFDASSGSEKQLAIKNGKKSRLMMFNENSDNLAIVKYDENLKPGCDVDVDDHLSGNDEVSDLVIPSVRLKEDVSDLKVRFMGSGQIAARMYEKNDGSNEIGRIWCQWLGKKSSTDEDKVKVLDHDFSVVTFAYDYELGKSGLFDDVKLLLSSTSPALVENDEGNRKRKRSVSDPEDVSRSLTNQYALCEEESSKTTSASSELVLDRYDDQLMQTGLISSKTVRREVRKQQRIAAEKMCDICQQKMLPEKDVATLWNRKTGKLACSSRNVYGAFHVFHTSCLIHWILYYCQGTGVNIKGDEFEKPLVPLSEMFRFKIKVSLGHRGWMKNPEILENCSTGFHFPLESGETVQEKVLPLKLLHFYRAEE
ncbi:unnamed protein product [Dovyalis caffra]|uniref:C2H2-type domain-containing protein n=1 Tax=Dovyalis caffra TaxID=77055 RepID=A0AAV1SHU4_9ROSI|nr:unnamed protein product [Dovyalis caffra]